MNKEKMMRKVLLFSLLLLVAQANAQILFNGKKAAIDNLTGTWLLSVPEAAFGSDYRAVVTLDDSVSQCTIDSVAVTDSFTFSNVSPGATYNLMAVRGNDTINADIQFTYWPIIQIYGSYVKRPYHNGTVVITCPDSLMQETISSRVRWAGSSTAGTDRKKHNFHLKFYNEDGSKMMKSFFGLRSDFHWRLDAGQIDFSRVRNRVAKDIWADFATPPYYAAIEPKAVRTYVRGDFVEVFLDDEYMGIYSLNEHMDRQQLKLKKYDYTTGEFHGGLWKPMSWTEMTTFSSLATAVNANSKSWDQFYVKYPNIDDVSPTNFGTLRDAIDFTINASDSAFLDSARYYFDIPVFRDYYLFTILLTAPDNVGKNLYYACYDVATDKRLTIAVWDLDCTQGQFWSNVGTNYHNEKVGPEYDFKGQSLSKHKVLNRLCETDPSFHGLATERYWALRGSIFNPDSIVARYQTYFNEMKACGADRREFNRWSRGSDLGGRVLDFDNELEYLRDWWQRHITYLDNNVFIPYPMGDVNFDRALNIKDATLLIDYLLSIGGVEDDSSAINTVKADIDGNQTINIKDLTMLIDMLLSLEE